MYDDGANSLLRAREREAHAPNASKQLQNSDISGVSDLSTKLWATSYGRGTKCIEMLRREHLAHLPSKRIDQHAKVDQIFYGTSWRPTWLLASLSFSHQPREMKGHPII